MQNPTAALAKSLSAAEETSREIETAAAQEKLASERRHKKTNPSAASTNGKWAGP
jgi:hypothetical protein